MENKEHTSKVFMDLKRKGKLGSIFNRIKMKRQHIKIMGMSTKKYLRETDSTQYLYQKRRDILKLRPQLLPK